jgi:hypothetical protein
MQLVAICNVAGCWMRTDQIARELPCLCVTVKIRGPSFLEAPARSLTSLPAVDGPVLTAAASRRRSPTWEPCAPPLAAGTRPGEVVAARRPRSRGEPLTGSGSREGTGKR